MDINNPLTEMVNSIVNEIQERVNNDINEIMLKNVEEAVKNFDFAPIVDAFAKDAVENIVNQIEIPTIDVESIKKNLEEDAQKTMANISQNTQGIVEETVIQVMQEAKIDQFIEELLTQKITTQVNHRTFLPNSIGASAINWEGHRLSGDHISGGIISNFSSIGIDDKASNCQLTIMDNVVVCEPPMITTGLEVRGNIIADSIGTRLIEVTGEFVGNAVEKLSQTVTKSTYREIKLNGLEATEIRNGDKILLNSNELGPTVLTSSLRKVGTLDSLETSGETSLSETLYAYRKKVGINTLEPGHTFTVWDGETECVIEKRSQNRVFIGTHRPQSVTIGSNDKDNLSIDPDGSVTINDLKLGAVTISTASQTPTWSGHTGELVFNDNPRIGSPSFWCCLGGHRWAIGAIISE